MHKVMWQIREKHRYIWAMLFLVCTILYNSATLPVKKDAQKTTGENNSFAKSQTMAVPTLYTKQPESVYEGVMQSRKGDVFRVAFEARGGNNPELELFVRSSLFYESVKVGEVIVESTEDNEYEEVVFVTHGDYDSIVIRLKGSESDRENWDNRFVFIDSLSITKLDIDPEKIAQLSPTAIGFRGIPQSRVEDLGSETLYTFALARDIVDYQSVFDASASTYFDGKKKAVVAAKKNTEYFTYKFDVAHPIKRLIIRAEQHGSDENEIRLQYSFDGSLWKTVEYSQKPGKSQRFFLSLDFAVPREKQVFVRISYEGEDKKTGTFALAELRLNALAIKQK